MTHDHHHSHEHKTQWVVILTAITMIVEIIFGITTQSMALLADGIHMLSHTGALGISWLAYIMVRKHSENKNFRSGTNKILDLSGYTSGIILLTFAGLIVYQSIDRILHPLTISYKEAIVVAVIGLIINLLSALILNHDHDEEHEDHNLRAAYLHVLADAITSVTAIAGLVVAMLTNFIYLDAIGGIISSIVIVKWSIGLLKKTGLKLLDYNK